MRLKNLTILILTILMCLVFALPCFASKVLYAKFDNVYKLGSQEGVEVSLNGTGSLEQSYIRDDASNSVMLFTLNNVLSRNMPTYPNMALPVIVRYDTERGDFNEVYVSVSDLVSNLSIQIKDYETLQVLETKTAIPLSDLSKPLPPTGLNANVLSYNQIQLSWNANNEPNLVGYKIYKNGLLIADTSNTSYLVTDLESETEYSFYITAYNNEEESDPSNTVIKTTQEEPDTAPPAVPTGFDVQVNAWDNIKLIWNANTESDLQGYRIYRDGVSYVDVTDGLEFIDINVDAEMTYIYQLSAFDNLGNESQKTEQITVTTPKETVSSVTNLIANPISESEISISWDMGSYTSFKVYLDDVFINDVSNNSYIFTNLEKDREYKLSVAAVGTNGSVGPLSSVYESTLDVIVIPQPVDNLRLGYMTVDSFMVRWDLQKGVIYDVYLDDVFKGNITGNTFTVKNTVNEQQYKIGIQAKNDNGLAEIREIVITQGDSSSVIPPLDMTGLNDNAKSTLSSMMPILFILSGLIIGFAVVKGIIKVSKKGKNI